MLLANGQEENVIPSLVEYMGAWQLAGGAQLGTHLVSSPWNYMR